MRGQLPTGVLTWLAPRDGPEHRTDHYLIDRLRRDVGAKRRGGSDQRVEVKQQIGASVPLALAPGCVGLVQQWTKRTVPVDAADGGPTAVVHKQRWRRDGLEVVELDVDGELSWSLALRWRSAPGTTVDVSGVLAEAGRQLTRLPTTARLGLDVSRSYPQWLLESRGPARRSTGDLLAEAT